VVIDGEAPVEQGGAGKTAEDEVRVRGRRGTAPAVGGRPGIGAGTLGADTQGATFVDTGDGATTGAHGMHVDGGEAYRKLRDRPLAGRGHGAVAETDVRGGAAHVKRDQPVVAEAAREGEGARNARGRTGEQRPRGVTGRLLRGQRAAAR